MINLLLVTEQPESFAGMLPAIEKMGGSVQWAVSEKEALSILDGQTPDAVVVDENLAGLRGLAFVEKVVAAHPLVNSALVSSLDENAFHEVSEGLGIMMQLPPHPTEADGERLMVGLRQIAGLTSRPTG